jgi:hypothetical protein
MKNYKLDGLSNVVQLGKDGPTIRANGLNPIEFTDINNSQLLIVQGETQTDFNQKVSLVNIDHLEAWHNDVKVIERIVNFSEVPNANDFYRLSINQLLPEGAMIEKAELIINEAFNTDSVNSLRMETYDSVPYTAAEFNGDVNEEGVGPVAGVSIQMYDAGSGVDFGVDFQLVGDGLKLLSVLISDYNSVAPATQQIQRVDVGGDFIVENGFSIDSNNNPNNFRALFDDSDGYPYENDLYVKDIYEVEPVGSLRQAWVALDTGPNAPTQGDFRMSIHYRIVRT